MAEYCMIQTDSAGNTYVAVFDSEHTAPIEQYVIPLEEQEALEERDE